MPQREATSRLTPRELIELSPASRSRLSALDKALLSAEVSGYAAEKCPRGWRWDEAAVKKEARRRQAERINVSTFAA